jgi:hypothetical protein
VGRAWAERGRWADWLAAAHVGRLGLLFNFLLFSI